LANIIGTVTVNQADVIEVDAVPSNSLGTAAPISSLALYNDGTIGHLYIKTGATDLDWAELGVSITPVSGSNGVNLFFNDAASGISTYDTLSKTPDSAAEVIESATVNNNTLTIDTYITDFAIASGTIDGGIWTFNLYAKASIAGTNYITLNVYKRTSGGTETLLFSVNTPNIDSTALELYIVSTVQQPYTVNATDKIFVIVTATTTNLVNTVIAFAHSGTAHYSYINTPLLTLHNDLSGLQGGSSTERYHLTTAQLTKLNTFNIKAGTITAASFTGNPRKATVTFGAAFPNTAYAISVSSTDNRSLSWESKAAGSFVINANSAAALTGNVDWIAVATGEST